MSSQIMQPIAFASSIRMFDRVAQWRPMITRLRGHSLQTRAKSLNWKGETARAF